MATMRERLFGNAISSFIYGVETSRFRLTVPAVKTAVRFLAGDGVPSGSYDLGSDSVAFYYRKDASTFATSVYFTADKGTTWLVPQALLATDSPTFAGLTLTNYLTVGSSAIAAVKALTTTNGVTSGTAMKVGGRAYALGAAGTALTNSTTETALGAYTIPANSFAVAGSTLKFRSVLRVTANASTTQLTTKLYFSNTSLSGAVLTLSGIDTAANDIIVIEGQFTARAVPGGTVSVFGSGRYSTAAQQGTAAPKDWVMTATNFATNAAIYLQVSGTWAAADANSVQCEEFYVEGPV